MPIPRQSPENKIPDLKAIAQGLGFCLSEATVIIIDAKDRELVEKLLEEVTYLTIQL